MLSHSQRDPQWAASPIPGSNLTIGRFGCVITAIADISTYFGMKLTPQDVALHCKFTTGGLIWWNSCVFQNFAFERREYGYSLALLLIALDDPDRAVILQVADASHWVVCLGRDEASGLFVIADPWIGDFTTMARYRNSITGAAYFRRK